MCLSHEAIDTPPKYPENRLPPKEFIEAEAKISCKDRTYVPFICLFALASILRRPIKCHFPDRGTEKEKLLYGSTYFPKTYYFPSASKKQFSDPINLLFCCLSATYKHDHFVPLVVYYNFKSKSSLVGVKHSLSVNNDTENKKFNEVGAKKN